MFDISILPYACQAQKSTFIPRRRRCNSNVEHCGEELAQGPYMAARAGFERARPLGRKATNLPMSHHAPRPTSTLLLLPIDLHSVL